MKSWKVPVVVLASMLILLPAVGLLAAEVNLNQVTFPERKSVDLAFSRTERAPAASVGAEVEHSKNLAVIELDFENMKPAVLFGGDVTCYVLWAVSRDGTAENLGEVWVRKDDGKGEYTCGLKSFALMITAEAHPLVGQPSELVLFTSNSVLTKYAKSAPFTFTNFGPTPPTEMASVANIAWDSSKPLDLVQAEKAYELAQREGAPDYVPQIWRQATTALEQARNLAGASKGKGTVDFSRRAVALASEAIQTTTRLKEREAIEQQIADRKREMETLEARAQSAEASAAETQGQLEQARLALTEAEQQKSAAAAAVTHARAELERLAVEKAAVVEEQQRLMAEKNAVLAERDALVAEKTGLATERDALVLEKSALAGERDALAAEKQALVAEKLELTEQQATLQASLEAMNTEAVALRTEKAALVQEKAALTTEKEGLIRQQDELLASVAEMAARTEALSKEKDALTASKDALVAEKEALTAERETLKAEQEKLRASMEDMEARTEALRKEKERMSSRLQSALSQVADTQNSARGMIVNLPDILFALDKAELKPEAREVIAKLSGILLLMPELNLRIEGHTDSTGSDDYNQRLSERRAGSVKDFLASQGIEMNRMVAVGYGEQRPVADNDSKAGRQKNRRVEIVIATGTVQEAAAP